MFLKTVCSPIYSCKVIGHSEYMKSLKKSKATKKYDYKILILTKTRWREKDVRYVGLRYLSVVVLLCK